jgi:hypothetical protein
MPLVGQDGIKAADESLDLAKRRTRLLRQIDRCQPLLGIRSRSQLAASLSEPSHA